MNTIIRPQNDHDSGYIRQLAIAAFPDNSEANLIDELRKNDDIFLSLVTELDGQIIAHVLLSPMKAPFRALGLAPLAVNEKHRNKGIAAELIKNAITRAKSAGWQAIFVLGNPDYYSRFGFDIRHAAPFASPYAGPYFMALPLEGEAMPGSIGTVNYASAFDNLE